MGLSAFQIINLAWLSQTADPGATLRYRLLSSSGAGAPESSDFHRAKGEAEMDRHQEGQRGTERHTGQSHKGEGSPKPGRNAHGLSSTFNRAQLLERGHGRKLTTNGAIAWTSINSLTLDLCGTLGRARQDPPALSKENKEKCEKRDSVCSFAQEPLPGNSDHGGTPPSSSSFCSDQRLLCLYLRPPLSDVLVCSAIRVLIHLLP